MDELKKQLDAAIAEKATLEVAKAAAAKEVAFLKDSLEKLNARVTAAESERDALAKAEAERNPKPVTLPKEVQEQINKALKDADDARQELAKMQDATDTVIYVAKASELKSLTQKPEEFGPLLKRVAGNKTTAEDVAVLETVLKSANATIATLLKTQGSDNGQQAGEATAKLDTLAKALAKSGSMTYEAAYAEVTKANPELYTQYVAESQ